MTTNGKPRPSPPVAVADRPRAVPPGAASDHAAAPDAHPSIPSDPPPSHGGHGPDGVPPRRRTDWRDLSARLRVLRSDRLPLRLAIAAAIVAAAAVTNRGFLGWGLFATVAVLLVPLGRARSFIVSFVPYALVWFLFSVLRSLADETLLARVLNTNVARFERWLFGGQLPTIDFQERLFDPSHLRWHDYGLTFVHWSYFLVPHAVAVRLWQTDPRRFRRFLGAMTLLLAVGLGIYFLIPSNPPWLAPDSVNSPAAVQVVRVMEPVGKALGGGLYAASYRVIGESNPIAAMPSIHAAITFLLAFAVSPGRRRWRLAAWLYAAVMGFALVYLGEHYVVDIAVGFLIAGYGWFAAGLWFDRAAPAPRSRPATAAQGAGA